MAKGIESLASHTFPTAEYPLAGLGVRVDDIASRLGFHVDAWVDEGLGPARGLACRLSSGLVFVLVEHELSIRHTYTRGPFVLVDASDLGARGASTVAAEVIEALGLSQAHLTWVAGRDAEQDAARLVDQVRRCSPRK